MLQAFIMRHVLAVVTQAIVKLIDKYGQDFDAEKAKVYIKEQVERTVPPSMWGEEFIERSVVNVTDFVIDRFAKSLFSSTIIVSEILEKLVAKDWGGAITVLRTFIVSMLQGANTAEEFKAKPDDVQSVEFAEVVQKTFSLESDAKRTTEVDSSGLRSETQEHKLA